MSKEGSTGFFGVHKSRPNFAFVDADNVRLGFRDSLLRRGIAEADLEAFEITRLFELASVDRTYIFSAVAEKSEPEEWLRRLRAAPTTIFRSATLTQKLDGSPRKQQGVDVMLAVQALKGAYSNTFQTCTLFSDDGDMLPLINALEDLGKTVVVCGFGDPEKSSVSSAIRDAADYYNHIGSFLLSECLAPLDKIIASGTGPIYPDDSISYEFSSEELMELCGCKLVGSAVQRVDGSVKVFEPALDKHYQTQSRPFVVFGSLRGLICYCKLRMNLPL